MVEGVHMSYQPLRDFVLVSKEEAEEKTPGGLIFRPSTVEDKIVKGLVIAVGSGRVTTEGTVVPLEVKVGDKVLFNKNFATELSGSGETALILREDQLLCIVK
jgi:chaperonin GroES